jgi:hypothetical protein
MKNLNDWQMKEFEKCYNDFSYFCRSYVKIIHPKRGLVAFELYDFQKRVVSEYEIHQYNIVRKFRQAGLTTVTVIWGLWRCLFRQDQRIMVLTKSDREARGVSKIVQGVKMNLPPWLQPEMLNDNDHEKEFADTGGVMWFFTCTAARSRALTYLIIDEAAFIPNMNEHWKAMYPTLSTGGSCIAISTVNGIGNWYEETYTKAEDHKNQFHRIDLNYREHPDYNNPVWEKRTRANLGPKGWAQEIEGNFLGSGETYISADVLTKMSRKCCEPIRKLFPDWDTRPEENFSEEDIPNEEYEPGALWVWKEPEEGHDYVIAADAAEGVGPDGDNSAFIVFDAISLEQVAEFYSNTIPSHKFAQVISQVGLFYKSALVVIENTMGPGLAVCNRLEHSLFYENLYYSHTGSRDKCGVAMVKNIRPVMLETMQTCLMNDLVNLKSNRLIRELRTFRWDKQKQKALADKGKHDDLVISLAIGLYVSDVLNREVPIGVQATTTAISDIFKSDNISFAQIKEELEKVLEYDVINNEKTEDLTELLPKVMFDMKGLRKFHQLLEEFGWMIFLPFTMLLISNLI